ncbi:hypothetical protein R4L22_12165 [Brachyspira pilosicoli]|uniref:hypothetical protein n=1 Tax=Brachyspira pilosicoli TaxID=52584 RepID=UPI0012F49CFF|nr:hypothetical protein [Brachyspira pilosicoli]
MKYIENILGDEKILHNIKDDDTAINYIKSFSDVLYCDYSYKHNEISLAGLFAYSKDNKYCFGEFGLFKENRCESKIVISDYPEYATLNNYELTNDKFIDVLNLHNITLNNLFSTAKKEFESIEAYPLKKISLDDYIKIFPHRYINNRFKIYAKNKYKKINIRNINEDFVYRCPYCASTNILKIIDINNNTFEKMDVYDFNDMYDNMENIEHDDFYVCALCNLVIRSPKTILDYI